MRPGARLAAALAVATTGLVACQLLVGVEDEPQNPRPEAGTAVDGAIESGADAGAPLCSHPRPPGPPASGALTPTTKHVFAVRRVKIGGYDDLERDFDFDDRCSCENREPGKSPTSCKQQGDPCSPPTDDPQGRDLGGRTALGGAAALGGQLENKDVNPRFETGVSGFLITIAGYNGEPDDTLVEVGLAVSNGIKKSNKDARERSAAEACAGLEMEGGVEPAWDGKDLWYRAGSGAALTQGHVRGNLVVVNGASNAYELSLSGQRLRQSRSVFVARIEKSPVGLKLHGNLVGLVKANDLLAVVGTFLAPGGQDGGRLCESPLLELFRDPICKNLDLSDEQNPDAPCDALALAFGIEAEEVDAESGPDPSCGAVDSGVPPCNVTCGDAGRD